MDYAEVNDDSDDEFEEDNQATFNHQHDPSRDAWDATEITDAMQSQTIDSGDMSQFPSQEVYQSQVDNEGHIIVKALKKVSPITTRTSEHSIG